MEIETLAVPPAPPFPNSVYPLVIYRAALPADPAAMERAFAAQGWTGSWRNGVFDYHHFHSTTHEVLGIAAGEVAVLFGGPGGPTLTLHAGDVAVIPAGVAHRNMGDTGLLVVGAYPGGTDCDVLRGAPAEFTAATARIAALPAPLHDPVAVAEGWLQTAWAAVSPR